MARMFPYDIKDLENATGGEKRVFQFLKDAARPHKEFICWHRPPFERFGDGPDFILLGRGLGLLIIKVIDWQCHHITSFNPFEFTIRFSDKTEKWPNPDKQVKEYIRPLTDKLGRIPGFLSDHRARSGELKLPIGRIVVFPFIRRDDYFEKGLQWLIPPDRALFRDDIGLEDEILRDPSGRKFIKRLSGALPFPCDGLTHETIDKLSALIWPEEKIDLPARQESGKGRFQKEVHTLDDAQAKTALRLLPGHQIIKGPPGSGKTLILVHRCFHLQRYYPKIKRILFVCYNIALVGYLKMLLREKGMRIGDKGILVCHFFELCAKILNEPVRFENEDSHYYENILQRALNRVKNGDSEVRPFDAILIDEGQDFSNHMLGILLPLLKPHGDLVITLDYYQDLYQRRPSWKSLGVKARGRTLHLRKVYRHTAEIFEFSQRFIGTKLDAGKQADLLSVDFAFHGDQPQLMPFGDPEEIEDFLAEDIRRYVEHGEFSKSEIGIIYDDKVYGPDRFSYDNRSLPMRILGKLESADIASVWVSQDARSKENYDPTKNQVSLISIHSAKGLDFDLVYLTGIDHIYPTATNTAYLVSIVYVALTRAKFRLLIPYSRETELIKHLKSCLPATDE
ncbi:MAG: AAA family ATPase [Deltaproteobacteria bacterium]|nr:AAA family ATPase [Deltaproteobacteria bacterium]